MENVSRPYTAKKSYAAATSKSVYDDVFGGVPASKYGGVPALAPRLEDYSEIFGGFHSSRVSSIPILDLPVLTEDEARVLLSFNASSRSSDYSEVFGGFSGEDSAVTFEELLGELNGGYDSSDEAWSPAQSESLSEESDPSAFSEGSRSLSIGDIHPSVDGVEQFNISYHQVNHGNVNNMVNGTVHASEHRAFPGYAYLVNGHLASSNAGSRKSGLQVNADDHNRGMPSGGQALGDKQLKKTMPNPTISGVYMQEVDQDKCGQSASTSRKPFVTVTDINLRTRPSRLPPPSRPPPALAIRNGNLGMPNSVLEASNCYAFDQTSGHNSPPFSHLEAESRSPAIIPSNATVGDALEQGQPKLRSAKQMTEKKETLLSHKTMPSGGNVKIKEEKTNRTFDGLNRFGEDRVLDACPANGGDTKKVTKRNGILPGFKEEKHPAEIARKSAERKPDKEYVLSEGHHRTDATVAWREGEEFYEVVETNILKQTSKKKKDEDLLVGMNKSHEHGNMEEKVTTDAFKQQECSIKLKASKEAPESVNNKNQLKAGVNASMEGESETKRGTSATPGRKVDLYDKVKLDRSASQVEQNRKKVKVIEQPVQSGELSNGTDKWTEKLTEAEQHGDPFEENSKLEEVNWRTDHETTQTDAPFAVLNQRIPGNNHEKEGFGRGVKESIEQLNDGGMREKQQEAPGKEFVQKKQKESQYRSRKGNKLRGSFQKEEDEAVLEEAIEYECRKKSYGSVNREENEEGEKLACEGEGKGERLSEACELKENEKNLKERLDHGELEETEKVAHQANMEKLNNFRRGEENEVGLGKASKQEGETKVSSVAFNDESIEKDPKQAHCWGKAAQVSEDAGRSNDNEQNMDGKMGQINLDQEFHLSTEEETLSRAFDRNKNEHLDAFSAAETCGKIPEALEEIHSATPRCDRNDKLTTEKGNEKQEGTGTTRELLSKRLNSSGKYRDILQNNENTDKVNDITRSGCLSGGGTGPTSIFVKQERTATPVQSDHENMNRDEHWERRKNIGEAQSIFDKEVKNSVTSGQVVKERVDNAKRTGDAMTTEPQNGENTSNAAHGNRRKSANTIETNLKGTIRKEEQIIEEKIKREREMENERLRKLEEEREREREREKDRMAVDRSTREALDKSYAEARSRAEKAAVERATAEVRLRAMAEAREKLEKASAEARDRTLAEKEARLRAERAAVDRATAEARQRAFEKAMAEKNSFEARDRMERSVSDKFSASSRSSDMRQNSTSTESQCQSTGTSSVLRYSYSSANLGVEGESPQRCKARLERYQRTADRAAKALAEKNMRDLLAQREQAERNRLAETLDAEVKRWSSGKAGNLRALLSTLQYILGPDSGWQPVPLTEVITSAAVKKAYRRATLCVHPDKLQQRGATIPQKYICEKVFDLLKEAWSIFNSEER